MVIYLVAVAGLQAKWLEILEYPGKGLIIPPLVFLPSICSVQLFQCHSGGHNLHDILWLLETKNIECLNLSTLFSYGLQHIHMSNILVSELFVNGISRYTLGPVFLLLDERSIVDTKLQQVCDPL